MAEARRTISGAVDPIGVISPHVSSPGRFLVSTVQNEVDVDDKDTIDFATSLTHVLVASSATSSWDKEYLWVDNRSTGSYAKRVYCGYSDDVVAGSPDPLNGEVYIQYSTDNAATWTSRAIVDAGATTDRYYIGMNLATAPDDGRVYATWLSGTQSESCLRLVAVREWGRRVASTCTTSPAARWPRSPQVRSRLEKDW